MTAPDALVGFHTDIDGGLVFQLLGRGRLAPVRERADLRTNQIVEKQSPQPLDHGLHVIDATLARQRGDAGSSPLDGASTASGSASMARIL